MPMGSKRKNAILYITSGVAVLALFISVGVAIWAGNGRNADRVMTDYRLCNNLNDGRAEIVDLGHAAKDMVNGILDGAFDASSLTDSQRQAAAKAFRERLNPPIQRFDRAVEAIKPIDCNKTVKGHNKEAYKP